MPWTDCEPGEYIAREGTALRDQLCNDCPDDLVSGVNATQCIEPADCEPGEASTNKGICEPCDAGYYCAGGTTAAQACANGRWDHDEDPASTCADWTQCIAGQHVDEAGTSTQDQDCTPCAAGTFSSTSNAASCTAFSVCAPAQVVSSIGNATSNRHCTPCPAGFTSIGANATSCVCADGYRDDGNSGCEDVDECVENASACTAGHSCQNVSGSFTCDCPVGTIDANGDDSACEQVVQHDGNAEHTCAITTSGRLFCWGEDRHGELGTAEQTQGQEGVAVGTSTDWTMVATGRDHTCGVRAGQLYCWGRNNNGQIGDGTESERHTPVRVGTASDWSSVSAGGTLTCGLRAGALYCWGHNGSGQLGDGSATNRSAPTRSGAASDWQSVSVGQSHVCGLRAGALYCWGNNADGQLGDSTLPTTGTAMPNAVGATPTGRW